MGNLNGPWTLGWTGKTTSLCSKIPLISHANEIYRIFQASPDGTEFVSQDASSADGVFSNIQNIECGTGAVVRLINPSADIPDIIESTASGNLVLPNFPMEIEIDGLPGDYGEGNGTYLITTFFTENSPTYQSNTGWTISRHPDGHWYIEHGIVGLGRLKGPDGGPADGAYVLDGCSVDCPRARPTDPASNQTPTPLPASTPTPPPTSELGFDVTFTSDTTINVEWFSTTSDVKNYFIELSTDDSFMSAKNITVDPTETSFELGELSHSTSYFLRIRLWNQNKVYSDWDTISTNTTIPANTTNPTATLTPSKRPKLSWTAPPVTFQYLVNVEKSTNGDDWDALQVISDASVVEFKDETAVDEGVYYYRLIFKTGDFSGPPSDSMKVVVDRTAPNPPTLTPNESNVASNRLNFSWTTNEDIKYYLYKFNGSSWISVTDNSISVDGLEGENIFRLKSVDHSENSSTEVWQKINVDLTPPAPPVLISPESPVNKTTQTYSWSNSSSDLVAYAYRLNSEVWKKLDKSAESVTLELSQGRNTFEIKAVDHVGHESHIISSITRVDSIPPDPPELSKIDPSESSGTLMWSWSGPSDVERYQYRFTTWGFDESAAELNWINLSKQVLEKSFTSVDGYNRFEIRSVDNVGNISEIESQTIALDLIPPAMPVLKTPIVSNRSGGDTYIVFSWELSNDTKRTRFRLNSESWFDEESSVVTVTLKAKQNVNVFEIYALDESGNKSTTNKIEIFVDSFPPSPPIITGPRGECPLALWEKLWTACQDSLNGHLTTVKLTYSFIPKTTLLYAPFEPNTAKEPGVMAEEPSSPEMSFAAIEFETHQAFSDWKTIIESAFENVSIEFENLGIETGKQMPSAPGVMYKKTNQGDIRIAFTSDIRTTTSDRSFDNQNPELKTGVGDVYVNAALNWKPDTIALDENSYSFRFGMRYYIGKSLGLEPNVNPEGTTHKIERGRVVDSKTASADESHFYNTYAYPVFLDTRPSLKVVRLSDLEMTWTSEEHVRFQWKYVFVGDQGEILTSSTWNTYSNTPSTTGKVKLDLDLSDIPSTKIRFYVLSYDSRSNKSDEAYVDIKIIHPGKPASILTVEKVCESVGEFKTGNNCWDKYGRFSCEIGLSRVLEKDESPLIVVKPREYSYSLITDFGSNPTSGLLTIDSLPPSTKTEISLIVRKRPMEFNYGFASSQEYSSKLGTLLTDAGGVKTLTTEDSDIIPPIAVKINNPEHYKEVDSTGFTNPIGEIRTENQSYVPAVKVSWVSEIVFDFKENRIIYSDSVNFNNSKAVVVTDINQNFVTIPLEKYATKYYFKIASYDESDNFSVSSTSSYTTVPKNHPPSYSEPVKVSTSGDLVTRYNERPGYKWTLEFKLPAAVDRNYPSTHKIPDTEMPTRTDYTESDWMSLLGHLPYKIEVLNWPDTPAGSWTVFWVSRNTVHDVYLRPLTTWKSYVKDGKICFKMQGFKALTEYSTRFTAYDATGHFVTQQYKFLTPKIDGDVTAPPQPSLDVNPSRFLNGYDGHGNSLKNQQWVLEFTWTIRETSDLAKFYLWYAKDGEAKKGGPLELAKLTKVVSGAVSRYTIRLSGFASKTRYTFYTESVDGRGNMSDRSDTQLTTSVGDTTPPEKPIMVDIRRWYHVDYGDSLVFKIQRRVESDLMLHIHITTNLSETNLWKYERKFYVPAESLKPEQWWVAKDIFKSGTVYKVAMAYSDRAMNWSPSPFYWQTPNKPEIENSGEIPEFESNITWDSQTDFADVVAVL